MADTEFGTNDVQTVKRWSSILTREAIAKTKIGKLAKRGTSNTFVKFLTDLEKGNGDVIYHFLRSAARGKGRYGSQRLEDFEERLLFPRDSLSINQLRNAHRYDQMSQQRVPFELRSEAKDSLTDWYAAAIDQIAACKLAGTVGVDDLAVGDSDLITFDDNSLISFDDDHRIQHGDGASSEEAFEIGHIEHAVAKAKTLRPRINPVTIDGGEYYVALLCPESVYQLRIDTGETKWNVVMQRAQERGNKNPIFTGALGIWGQCIMYEWEYLPKDTATAGSETCYNLLLGREAASIAFGGRRVGALSAQSGQMFSWREQDQDYGDKMGVGVASICGFQANTFDSNEDGTATPYGIIRIETLDAAV